MVSTGSCVPYPLEGDWKALGGKAFALEIFEELEQKDGQSHDDFVADLKALEQMRRDRMDGTKEYR
jgi:hypothetical protein